MAQSEPLHGWCSIKEGSNSGGSRSRVQSEKRKAIVWKERTPLDYENFLLPPLHETAA
jgi:hypothetical protein